MPLNFKTYFESEEKQNVVQLIQSLPKGHQKLLDGYKFKFTPGNTLNGDDQHVGYIHKDKIVVAAPWNYGRAFTTLHEIAHLVWDYKMSDERKKEWKELLKKTKAKFIESLPKKNRSAVKQDAEEIFAMVYANVYSKHSLITYNHPDWKDFILTKIPS